MSDFEESAYISVAYQYIDLTDEELQTYTDFASTPEGFYYFEAIRISIYETLNEAASYIEEQYAKLKERHAEEGSL